jgi:hypothetical protein
MAMLSFLHWLFGTGPCLWVVAIGIGGGLTLALAPQNRNVRLAHWFFGFAWIWAFGGIIEVLIEMKLPLKIALPLAFVATGFVGVLAILSSVWVETNHQDGGRGSTAAGVKGDLETSSHPAAVGSEPGLIAHNRALPPIISKPDSKKIEGSREEAETRNLLRNVEFLQHRTDKINRIVFFIRLDKPYPPQELGPFHVLLTVLNPPTDTIYVSATDSYASANQNGLKSPLFGTQHLVWSADQNLKFSQVLQNTVVIGTTPTGNSNGPPPVFALSSQHLVTDRIDAWSTNGGPFATLNAFDNAVLTIHLSASLWPKVSYIGLIANDYLLLGQPHKCLTISSPVHAGKPSVNVDWPAGHRPPEDMQWVNVVPAGISPSRTHNAQRI